MSDSSSHESRSLTVPARDGAWLADPPLRETGRLVRDNGIRLSDSGTTVCGQPLHDLREQARSVLTDTAFRYTSELTGSTTPARGGPIIVSGHQPELFHAGVWAKNFAAGAAADVLEGTAVNLVVDNDVCASASVRIPSSEPGSLDSDRIFFEQRQPTQPWEERQVTDRAALRSFGSRVSAAMTPWGIRPVIAEIWSDLPLDRMTRLADVLTQARAQLEASRNVRNLELPISRMCETDPFRLFAVSLFADAERFRAVHNRALDEYRRAHHVRSTTHPVPALDADDGWIESPFWTWRSGDRTRKRLFVRQRDQRVALSDGSRTLAELPDPAVDATSCLQVLAQLGEDGEKIRTRALTTTLFSRLFFADVFVHGIGGARYDEMTDALIRDFYSIEPPGFITVSATMRLLADHVSDSDPDELSRLQRSRRDLDFSPEQALATSANAEVVALVTEKQKLIAEQRSYDGSDAERNRWRYRRFRELNELLASSASDTRADLDRRIEAVTLQRQRDELLQSRDLSFCLFPAGRLWELFDRITASAK